MLDGEDHSLGGAVFLLWSTQAAAIWDHECSKRDSDSGTCRLRICFLRPGIEFLPGTVSYHIPPAQLQICSSVLGKLQDLA